MAVAKKKQAAEAAGLAVTVKRSDLLRALAMLRPIAGAKAYPITANVMLHSTGDGLTIEATNLDVFGTVVIPGAVDCGGAVTVDAKRLGEFVRELRDGDLSIVGHENASVEVRSGKSRAKLAGMSAADFPVSLRSEGDECRVTIDGDSLGDMIDRAIFAVATDDVRPTLSGLLFEMRPASLGIAGTDGHRLSHETVDVECSGERDAIIPAAALRVVRRALVSENVTVAVSGAVAWFSCADWMIGARLVDGEYPNYDQVVPKATQTVIDVSRDELLASVRRVSVVLSDRARGIKVRVAGGSVELAAQSADFGEASESVACEVVSGGEAEAGFNARYVLEALESVSGASSVRIGIGSDHSPAAISVPDLDGWLHVVMPMRL